MREGTRLSSCHGMEYYWSAIESERKTQKMELPQLLRDTVNTSKGIDWEKIQMFGCLSECFWHISPKIKNGHI
uniref:Uncharacterized protein n=2 Tax=Anguilla anguilla TaxID=7936 RepID=A0A0E9VHS3_ANGAN